MTSVSSNDDIIDSRDVVAAVDEYEADRAALEERIEEIDNELTELDDDSDERADLNEERAGCCDELAELEENNAGLLAFAKDFEGYAADYRYGEAAINDDYFEEYAQQLAADIGAIDRDANWPLSHIDWTAAADALKQDYTAIEFQEQTFWVR